jgi:hypothetical protein
MHQWIYGSYIGSHKFIGKFETLLCVSDVCSGGATLRPIGVVASAIGFKKLFYWKKKGKKKGKKKKKKAPNWIV